MYSRKKYFKNCKIFDMLHAAPKHLSFHTPGHKYGKWDITELSFSDNLSNPTGVLKEAQADIAHILGAEKSFILTDGSTCGVLSMLYAVQPERPVFSACAHKSVYNACKLLGATPVVLPEHCRAGVPVQPTAAEIEAAVRENQADCVILTSPDYYGNIVDYEGVKAVCSGHGIPLLCDGAHGSHLHGTKNYAGIYCDLWVDGVHKSLPALTQCAVVSAKKEYAAALENALDIFRTTSPNYLLMASVEYAVKYPRKPALEAEAEKIKGELGAYANDDWTKIIVNYGENAQKVIEYLEKKKVYAEFCDGENILFYLSPATSRRQLHKLKKLLLPLSGLRKKNTDFDGGMPAIKAGNRTEETLLLPLEESVGFTCARNAGRFPPCIPLLREGQEITRERIERFKGAKNTYGLTENKVLVYKKCEEK